MRQLVPQHTRQRGIFSRFKSSTGTRTLPSYNPPAQ
jgi:hypothetical protein